MTKRSAVWPVIISVVWKSASSAKMSWKNASGLTAGLSTR